LTDAAVTPTFSDWTNSNSYCGAFVYTTSALPGFVSFNAATKTFSYSTSAAGDVGSHSITITGTSSTTVGTSLSYTNTHTFTIDVQDGCQSPTITKDTASITTENYVVAAAAITPSFNDWT